ncbi:MAG TPA: universal stress protein [Vicinamibacteria bacterium]|nr:universal stress protein [Vicinamibacteria bacterium]
MSKAIKKILVPVDLSEGSRAALDYASGLARKLGAHLTALHVTAPYVTYEPLPAFPPLAPLDPSRQRAVEESLRQFVAPPGSDEAPPAVLVREGDPADEILAEATASGADLIVLGTHGRRGFERWVLGSVTERVTRKADRPVLAVPQRAAAATFARVLCALDLSDSSPETLTHAAALAGALDAKLNVLYVASDSHWYEPGPLAGVDLDAVRQAVGQSSRKRLAEMVARHVPDGTEVELRVAFGRAHREIEEAAGEGADMVVLGASASSGVDRFFFGSTVQHVLRAGVCPVLVVRHIATSSS